MSIAVVTDSSACLPAELIARDGLTVVPLIVTIGSTQGREGVDVSPAQLARALAARRVAVTTSRPSPGELSEVYGTLLAGGATGIVSVHLSARLSGTYDAAVLAAADHAGLVEVVDSRSTGMGLGFPALHARGESLPAARDAALAAVARTTTLFYVDSLEHLRRGGRMGTASALLGTALSVKPILHMSGGEIVVRDRVRTATRAMGRLVDLALEAAGQSDVDIAVHHLAASGRAAELTGELTDRLGARMRTCYQTEIGAAVGAHVGPGLVSVVVHTRSTD
jgi:DegV family protein with EDD domain